MAPLLRIGLVFNYHLGYARGVLRGIKHFAQTRAHWILVPVDGDGLSQATLKALRPAGLIASVQAERQRDVLRRLRRPLVNVGSVLPTSPFPRVSVNHLLVGQLAAEHFRQRCFRSFGFVGHPLHFYSTQREAGFRQALAADGYAPARYYERPARSYRQRGRLLVLDLRLQRWLAGLPKPAGIFACHDVWALQVVEACRLAGLRVPEDVAVLGVDNDDLLCELARPSLSSVIVPAERVGYEAAALLDRWLSGTKPPRQPILIPPTDIVTRQSSDVVASDDATVAAAMRFLRDNAHLPLRVADVLRQLPVSRRALERRFQAQFKRGLGEEIRRLHVERARHLLATTELSMSEIADRAGFASQPQLSRVFRQDTGLTPTAYRRQTRGRRDFQSVPTI